MIDQFLEFIDTQYERFLDYEFGKQYSYFDEMYSRLGSNYLERCELKDIRKKEIELKKTYTLCSKNISDFIKKVKQLSDPDTFINDYKEWKKDQGEELEVNFDQSEDFYSYYNDTFDLLWNDLQEDSEYSELFEYLKDIDYRDNDDLLRKLRILDEEIDEMYEKICEFLSFKNFNKTQLIECLFSDEEIDLDELY